jgi:imidazole glycerol phosphate synthase glutamine amidotransferase subunit
MRVIARLDIKGPNVVKGVQFEALRVIGKPGDIAEEYFKQGADELVYLDIVASLYQRDNLLHIVREASKRIHIPFTAGGGVRSIEDIRALLQAGADKVAINTAATKRPELISEAAHEFGTQCVVLSIEAKRHGTTWEAYRDNGRERTGFNVIEWAKQAEQLGAGEILLTSVDNEGTQKGLDTALITAVSKAVTIPVIASGGACDAESVAKNIDGTNADAVAVGTMLHYGKANIADIKEALLQSGIIVRPPLEQEKTQREIIAKEPDLVNYNRFTSTHLNTPSLSINTVAPVQSGTETINPADADVCIVDYGVNNVSSVQSGFENLGKKAVIVKTAEAVRAAKRLVLPGVGSFAAGMDALKEAGLVEALVEKAAAGTPLLGICLGMQLLFDSSEEFGHHKGLGIIPGKVISLPDPHTVNIPGYKLPNIGWSTIASVGASSDDWQATVLQYLHKESQVYFVHSLYPIPSNPADVLAVAYGGVTFCAVAKHGNITATQFHPEKSSAAGLTILKAFCE